VLGTTLNGAPLIAHNVPILAARLPFYYSFLDMSTFIVLLAVRECNASGTGGVHAQTHKAVKAAGLSHVSVRVGKHWEE
jgi:hypothetical protein